MPLYEYECKKCHHRFERIQKFSARHLKKCPDCGAPVEQLISAATVQFKGSGWYVNDYAKKSGSSASSSGESSAKSESASKAESSSKKDESTSKKDDKPRPESKKAEKK